MKMNRRNAGVFAGLLTAALIAIGCGSGKADTGEVSSDAAGASAAASAAPTLAKMGIDKVTFPGAVVRTTKPGRYVPSQTAWGYTAGQRVFGFDVTVENTDSRPLDVTLLSVSAMIGVNGTKATQVTDSEKNLLGFSGVVPPGGKMTTKFAFAADGTVADLKKITVTIEPSLWGDEVALFQGAM